MDTYSYATLADLDYTNSRVDAVEVRAMTTEDRMRDQIGDLYFKVDEVSQALETRGAASEIWDLKDELDSIKSVLIDIQDMLRRLGLDDLKAKSGDLDLLLTGSVGKNYRPQTSVAQEFQRSTLIF